MKRSLLRRDLSKDVVLQRLGEAMERPLTIDEVVTIAEQGRLQVGATQEGLIVRSLDARLHVIIKRKKLSLPKGFQLPEADLLRAADFRKWYQARLAAVTSAGTATPLKTLEPTPGPPKAAKYVGYLLIARADQDAILGDLEETFTEVMVPQFGQRAAAIWFWKQILGSVRWLLPARVAKLLTFRWLLDEVLKRIQQ